MARFSVLDFAPIPEGKTVRDGFQNTLALAQHVEQLGFERFWLAEHHNMVGIGSAATSLLIQHVAAGTSRIRVGSGGIMLPNHSPLVIAEQFGTLEALFPGRIDLGVGRAPGTDQFTMRALRRDPSSSNAFPSDVRELQHYLAPAQPGQRIVANPGVGSQVPIWMLGSSTFGARLAAQLGLPYAFASHFAPAELMNALQVYRENFQPSGQLSRPYAMVCGTVICADSDAEAQRLFTTAQLTFAYLLRNKRGALPPPVDNIDDYLNPAERAHTNQVLERSFVGSPWKVRQELDYFLRETGADELMVCDYVHDQDARRHSYSLLGEVMRSL